MKKLSYLFIVVLSVLFSNTVFADPHDCMTKAEADLLASKIVNTFIMDYCDCCDENNPKANKWEVGGKLLYIKTATVVPCEYDAARYSVKITFDFIGAFDVKDGIIKTKKYKDEYTTKTPVFEYVSLNYHFYTDGKKAYRMYDLVKYTGDQYGTCKGLNRFPTADEVKNNAYKEFLNKL